MFVAALGAATVSAWIYVCRTTYEAMATPGADGFCVHNGEPWSTFELSGTLAMWLLMMVTMMVPVVLPWAVALARHHRSTPVARGTVAFFLGGYVIVWLAFGIGVTALQWALARAGLATLVIDNAALYGLLLILVGAYQWTPLKDSCLTKCESPFVFFLSRWRDGRRGALAMGAHHGLHCLGCCWLLMLFMVLVGAMSFPWMVGITLYMLCEMYLPNVRWLSRAAGGVLVAAGLGSMVSAFF